ncbi:hypothetical protein HY750_03280 [Candidatus Kuenenbacteria bacterium]|nr:hypothetical protein [Candidatus Kuenenbacteria bacterium]
MNKSEKEIEQEKKWERYVELMDYGNGKKNIIDVEIPKIEKEIDPEESVPPRAIYLGFQIIKDSTVSPDNPQYHLLIIYKYDKDKDNSFVFFKLPPVWKVKGFKGF